MAASVKRSQDKPELVLARIGTRMLQFLGQRLKSGNPAATIDRFFGSQHVADLRFIVAVALMLLCISVVPCLIYAFETATPSDQLGFRAVQIIGKLVTLLTTLVALFGAICAWAYKVGSARLGVVDLFACEMNTLCRVATVIDTVGRLTERIRLAQKAGSKPDAGKPGGPASNDRANSAHALQFTSAENYFPIFESNSRDLQSLEARVVINITSFYTYMKTVRDLMRAATVLKADPVIFGDSQVDQLHADTWHNAMRDVIYMLFLALEAGRSSVKELVEFEPEQAERLIVVLLSELKAYLFLLQEFAASDDMRGRRLLLRWETYQKVFKNLRCKIKDGVASAKAVDVEGAGMSRSEIEVSIAALTLELWEGAEKLWPDLEVIYQKVAAFIPTAD